MKLTYRGVSYDYTPNPVPKMGPAYDVGSYRGAAVTFRAVTEIPEQPGADLTWRGVAYHTGSVAPAPIAAEAEAPVAIATSAPALAPALAPAPAPAPASTAANGVTALARNLFIRRHQRMRRREQGMMVRLAAEVGMPVEAAGAYESHIQGKLPHDFSAYDRSATAMS
jgi:hypothetical protein